MYDPSKWPVKAVGNEYDPITNWGGSPLNTAGMFSRKDDGMSHSPEPWHYHAVGLGDDFTGFFRLEDRRTR